MKLTAESNGHESQNSDAGTLTEKGAHHNNISAFGESINSDNEEPTCLPSPVPDNNEESLPPFQEKVDYLQFEIRGTTLNAHFSKVLEGRMLRS